MRLRGPVSRLADPPTWLTMSAGIAAIVTQGGIAVTGSVVRVTDSGLGCPTWPRCHEGSLTPTAQEDVEGLHQWVEFGNRLLTGLVVLGDAVASFTPVYGQGMASAALQAEQLGRAVRQHGLRSSRLPRTAQRAIARVVGSAGNSRSG